MSSIDRSVRSVRLVRWWTQWYTAGLPGPVASERRAEIESDLDEHIRARTADGWAPRRIARERLWRVTRGMPADVGWRRDVLVPTARSSRVVRTGVVAVTTVASLALAAFHAAFAAYLLGATWLADRALLGGIGAYADEVHRPVAATIAAVIVAVLGLVLFIGGVCRGVSPLVANVATVGVASLSVMFFWLGMAPIALAAIAGSVADAALRAPAFAPPR